MQTYSGCRILLAYAKIRAIISESKKGCVGEVEESDVQISIEQSVEENEQNANETNFSENVDEDEEEENDDEIEDEEIAEIDEEEEDDDDENDPNVDLLSSAENLFKRHKICELLVEAEWAKRHKSSKT